MVICTLFHVIAVPERLQKRIDEPKEDEILDRPLSEIMVDAEDCPLVERAQNSVQIARRGEVSAKWLFENNAGPLVQPDFASCSTTSWKSVGGMAR